MPHETPNETELIRYARAQELKGKSSDDLLERYKALTIELGGIPFQHKKLEEVEAALEDEIQPYLDTMDAIEDQDRQDAYILSLPEHVRHSIDLLTSTQDALTHLEELQDDLLAMQSLVDQLYDESLKQKEADKLNRSVPN
ncbi:hypothetical protein HZA87_04985 [Candidatus Uhrbacteria bacterium]|nr:hypothetical protein [Candidatus Uhrbacteria bacterium]